jgi:beta-glucosidase
MREVGAMKTVLAIYFRNPYVLDDESRLKEAGAILASFGVRKATSAARDALDIGGKSLYI